ncbi:endonuclease [Bacteroidia bacterium]|nr:endonuclease [Bacteroidia bacterium]
MSFNVRYDNPEDGDNAWENRKDLAAQIVTDYQADIVGTQEVLYKQLLDIAARLPKYAYIGVGRGDGEKGGEFCAILYKKDVFSVVDSGTFWLSETPDRPGSKGWDAACERIGTWAILMHKKTKKKVFAINTHLDHVGKKARREGVFVLLTKTRELSKGLPVILTGDFNATPDSEPIQHILSPGSPVVLVHTKDVAKEFDGSNWTFHSFGKVPFEDRVFIDYIFVSPNIKVLQHTVLPDKLDGKYITDHSVVTALIQIPFK